MSTSTKVFGVITALALCYVVMYYEGDILGIQNKMSSGQKMNIDNIYKDAEMELEILQQEEEKSALAQDIGAQMKIREITETLPDRFLLRKKHLTETCRKYHLDKASFRNDRRTDQFLINSEHGLIWCNIFKAASTTWLWNFSKLAGYSEQILLENTHRLLQLAREIYRRPFSYQLDDALNADPPPVTFIIVRHPFHRLISGFRDKILGGKSYYRPVAEKMMKSHPELKNQHPPDWKDTIPLKDLEVPTFAQFAQFLVDQRKNRKRLNEHWIPMNEYCTPCLNHFDVIAKVETLDEDGNFIIYKAGIQDIIKPKTLNKANGNLTEDVSEYYICQLNHQQLLDLIDIYKYDFELFDYDYQRYIKCTNSSKAS